MTSNTNVPWSGRAESLSSLNRPAQRNAMSPELHYEMEDVIDRMTTDTETQSSLTGVGESWCAGQDIRLYFRATRAIRTRTRPTRQPSLAVGETRTFPLPTIAMVNGYCYGAAFTQLCAVDSSSRRRRRYMASEVNWGIIPGGS